MHVGLRNGALRIKKLFLNLQLVDLVRLRSKKPYPHNKSLVNVEKALLIEIIVCLAEPVCGISDCWCWFISDVARNRWGREHDLHHDLSLGEMVRFP